MKTDHEVKEGFHTAIRMRDLTLKRKAYATAAKAARLVDAKSLLRTTNIAFIDKMIEFGVSSSDFSIQPIMQVENLPEEVYKELSGVLVAHKEPEFMIAIWLDGNCLDDQVRLKISECKTNDQFGINVNQLHDFHCWVISMDNDGELCWSNGKTNFTVNEVVNHLIMLITGFLTAQVMSL